MLPTWIGSFGATSARVIVGVADVALRTCAKLMFHTEALSAGPAPVAAPYQARSRTPAAPPMPVA